MSLSMENLSDRLAAVEYQLKFLKNLMAFTSATIWAKLTPDDREDVYEGLRNAETITQIGNSSERKEAIMKAHLLWVERCLDQIEDLAKEVGRNP